MREQFASAEIFASLIQLLGEDPQLAINTLGAFVVTTPTAAYVSVVAQRLREARAGDLLARDDVLGRRHWTEPNTRTNVLRVFNFCVDQHDTELANRVNPTWLMADSGGDAIASLCVAQCLCSTNTDFSKRYLRSEVALYSVARAGVAAPTSAGIYHRHMALEIVSGVPWCPEERQHLIPLYNAALTVASWFFTQQEDVVHLVDITNMRRIAAITVAIIGVRSESLETAVACTPRAVEWIVRSVSRNPMPTHHKDTALLFLQKISGTPIGALELFRTGGISLLVDSGYHLDALDSVLVGDTRACLASLAQSDTTVAINAARAALRDIVAVCAPLLLRESRFSTDARGALHRACVEKAAEELDAAWQELKELRGLEDPSQRVRVTVDGHSFECSRETLSRASPVMRAMFDGNWAEKNDANIKFVTGAHTFGLLVEVLEGACDDALTFVGDEVLIAADALMIPSLAAVCAYCFTGYVDEDSIRDKRARTIMRQMACIRFLQGAGAEQRWEDVELTVRQLLCNGH